MSDISNSAATIAAAQTEAAPRPARPVLSKPRFALLVLIGVYPLVTALNYLASTFTHGWEIWQRSLVVTPFMVAAMVWGLIPFIQKRFHKFIMGQGR